MQKKQQAVNCIKPGISCFAWNADCSKVAVCPTSNEILIFETNNQPLISDWKLLHVLKEVSTKSTSYLLKIYCAALCSSQCTRLAP